MLRSWFRDLNMVDINWKKLPPVTEVTEGYSWPLPNPHVSKWAKGMTSFCVLYRSISLKRSVVPESRFSMAWECLGSRGKKLEKRSLDPYKIHFSEILDLSISLDSGHEYLIFQLSMTKNLAKTGGRIRRGNYF